MIGAGAVQTIALTQFANANTLLDLLSGGSAVPARIVPHGAGVALVLPHARLPLPEGTSLPAGTTVHVRLVDENGAKQLQIRPQPASIPPIAASPPSPNFVPSLLSELLPALSAVVSREQAAALVPALPGIPKETVGALLRLLVGRERVSMQLAQLGEAIDAAVASGKLPAGVRDQFVAIANRLMAETSAEFERALLAARASLRGVRPGAGTTGDRPLLDELLALRSEIVAQHGRAGATGDSLVRMLDGLVERFDAARLQNVRGFELPYQFIELPLPRESGLNRAQIHFFGDESRTTDPEKRMQSVVLDLELSRLGALWIQLRTIGNTCDCLIRASDASAVQALDAAAPSLTEALQVTGYTGVEVRAESWDGERVSALAAMASRFSGFEADA